MLFDIPDNTISIGILMPGNTGDTYNSIKLVSLLIELIP